MPQRTRVKICGITRPQDGQAAAIAGADAIGLVFYPPSPRAITPHQAQAIVAALPPFITTVGLFVNPAADYLSSVLAQVPLDILQFHGQEPPEFCGAFGRPYLKGVAMAPELNIIAYSQRYTSAQAILVDSYHPGLAGGTGACFDWERIPVQRDFPLILAGGLTPTNVAQAVRQVRPYAVDVSSGVEATKGIKDPAAMAALVAAVVNQK